MRRITLGQRRLAKVQVVVVTFVMACLSACVSAPPPSPPAPISLAPPPPPPPAVIVPPKPLSPLGVFGAVVVPLIGEDGKRQTINYGISLEQKIWNIRSSLNVAALNCSDENYAAIADNYADFIRIHRRELSQINQRLSAQNRRQHGSSFRQFQDQYMTKVYNYFALPPALPELCVVASELSTELIATPPGELHTVSDRALQRIEQVYENLFSAYEQYRIELASWEAVYGDTEVVTLEADYQP